MYKYSVTFSVLLILSALSGCNKIPVNDPVQATYDLSFNILAGQSPGGLKATPDCLNENQLASYVEITLSKQGDVTASTIKVNVFHINNQAYTNTIKLLPGTYTIQEFVMKNDNMTPDILTDDPVIAAAVHQGAAYASLVTSWLTKEFVITPFQKNVLDVELVCYDEANFDSFGFEYFQIDQIVIREQNFFGDLCIQSIQEYYNSPYSEVLGGNGNLLLDLPAIIQIEVVRNGISIVNHNNNSPAGISQPLKIQYADRLNITDNFEFKLAVMVRNGIGFQYEHFHTWSFQDAQKIYAGTDGDGVVDFVLGNCMPGADLVIPYGAAVNEAPLANNVEQNGIAQPGQVLTGSYVFHDTEGDLQGASLYKWYRADNVSGLNEVEISGAQGETYTLQPADLNKYIRFAVIPVALTGTQQGTEIKAPDYAGPVTAASFTCGTPVILNHPAGIVAPVNKSVTYGTVTNIAGEPLKCWITSNLGADRQATAKNDQTEASAGWYWQFNRKQGYKHDGTSRTPNNAWSSISENSDWTPDKDPCALLIGTGWRIPTNSEWTNVRSAGNWNNLNKPWNSDLKMHAAGYLKNWGASLMGRGVDGNYWSSSQNGSESGSFLLMNSSNSYIDDYGNKASGMTLRCLLDN